MARGSLYSMVVSDPYGLVRYQTDDLFQCGRSHAVSQRLGLR